MKKIKINIPEDWIIHSIGEIGKVYSGGTPDTAKSEYWNGKFDWCTPTDITALTGKKYLAKTKRKISELGLKKSSANLLPTYSLIVCTRATIGECAINTVPMSTNQGFKNIVLNSTKINIDFLYYFIVTSKQNLKRLGNGSTFLEISKKDFENIKIPLPPLPEQKKIAKILSTWDNAIETTSKLIQAKQKQKKGLLHKLICNPADVIKIENKKLGDFLKLNLYKTDKPKNNYLALGLRSHGKGIFHKQNIDPKSNAMTSLYGVKEDELIVNITFAWEGAIAIVKKEDEGGLVSHRFPTYKFNKDVAIPEFFKYVIITERFKYFLGLISPGGAGRNRVMSKKDFLKLKWPVPSVKEQKQIASILSTADKEIEHLQNYLAKLQEQKKGLMQQLLTGKKKVKTN